MSQRVAILGASDNPERYAYKAYRMLKEYGHEPIPVNPSLQKIEETSVVSNLKDINGSVETLTLYVRPEISTKLESELLNLKPKRVIFNPGTENSELKTTLEKNGIHTVEACTLVLLRTQQFETA